MFLKNNWHDLLNTHVRKMISSEIFPCDPSVPPQQQHFDDTDRPQSAQGMP